MDAPLPSTCRPRRRTREFGPCRRQGLGAHRRVRVARRAVRPRPRLTLHASLVRKRGAEMRERRNGRRCEGCRRAGPYRRDGRLGELHECLRYRDGDERICHGYGAILVALSIFSLLVEIDGQCRGVRSSRVSCLCLLHGPTRNS